jgi:hypothetical protein
LERHAQELGRPDGTGRSPDERCRDEAASHDGGVVSDRPDEFAAEVADREQQNGGHVDGHRQAEFDGEDRQPGRGQREPREPVERPRAPITRPGEQFEERPLGEHGQGQQGHQEVGAGRHDRGDGWVLDAVGQWDCRGEESDDGKRRGPPDCRGHYPAIFPSPTYVFRETGSRGI